MLQLPEEIKLAGLKARMLLQVHDELIFEVPKEELKSTVELVTRVMEGAYTLAIPLSTEAKAGPSWGEMEKL
jgi:DNA polymerase-1